MRIARDEAREQARKWEWVARREPCPMLMRDGSIDDMYPAERDHGDVAALLARYDAAHADAQESLEQERRTDTAFGILSDQFPAEAHEAWRKAGELGGGGA